MTFFKLYLIHINKFGSVILTEGMFNCIGHQAAIEMYSVLINCLNDILARTSHVEFFFDWIKEIFVLKECPAKHFYHVTGVLGGEEFRVLGYSRAFSEDLLERFIEELFE